MLASNLENKHVFRVAPDGNAQNVTHKIAKNINTKTTYIGFAPGRPCLIHIQNSGKKIFKRDGTGTGEPMQEIILVDKNGNIDSSTPVTWDYGTVTYARAYFCDDKPITISGGEFTTWANHDSNPNYAKFYRGILVNRSNVTVKNLNHRIENEGATGSPYYGFLVAQYCNNVVFQDCILQGHKTYKSSSGSPKGSYDIIAEYANNINWVHVTQFNSIGDKQYWGIMGSNYCRNLTYDRCYLSRFDAHMGVYNATIKNSKLGYGLINVVGFGTLTVDNVTVYGNNLIKLREDYGSSWCGEIVINNVNIDNNSAVSLVDGKWKKADFGYIRYLPKVTVNGVKLTNPNTLYVFGDFGKGGYHINEQWYPTEVTVSGTNATTVIASSNKRINNYVKLIKK